MIQSAEGPTIQTRSGIYFNFLDPFNSEIRIEDIASALSKICRFTGHCSKFYSVAEHAVNVSKIVELRLAQFDAPLDWSIVRQAFHHDDPEAYIGDIAAPLKRLLPDYKNIEKNVEAAVLDALNVPHPFPALIKWADMVALKIERKALMDCSTPWPMIDDMDSYGIEDKIQIYGHDPMAAELNYLRRHHLLENIS